MTGRNGDDVVVLINGRVTLAAVALTCGILVAPAGATTPYVQQAVLGPLNLIGSGGQTFGQSVAATANVIVVGRDGNGVPGAVDVYEKPSRGWSAVTAPTAVLTDPTGMDFGDSVAIDAAGDTVVVGADETFGSNKGATLVYQRPPGGWASTDNPTAQLAGSDTGAGDFFGSSVAISAGGSTIAIGASNHQAGAAYIYVKPGATWLSGTQSAELTATGASNGQQLGASIAVSDDGSMVFAGAPAVISPLPLPPGSVYAFERPGAGWANTVHQAAVLNASDGAPGDQFGTSIALDGSVLAVGADTRGPSNQGAAYVFVEPSGGWATATQNAELHAPAPAPNADIGTAVAIGPDGTVIAGASAYKSPGGAKGSAYAFHPPGSGWPATPGSTVVSAAQLLAAADGTVGNGFGFSATFAGANPVVGAPNAIGGPPTFHGEGEAYVFGPPPPTVTIIRPAPRARYIGGTSVKASYSCADPYSTITSCTGTVANGARLGMAVGAHTFRVTAIAADGGSAVVTVRYMVVKPPRPVLSGLKQAHKRWCERHGTSFTFKLSEAAELTLSFHRHHAKTVTITTKAVAGLNHLAFFGALTGHRRLKPGRYTVAFAASTLGGRSKSRSLTFMIVRC